MQQSLWMPKYGKFKRSYSRGPAPPRLPEAVRFDLVGVNDLEQASQLFQLLIAELQTQGVTSLERLVVECAPRQGGVTAPIRGPDGSPLDKFTLRLPARLRFAKAIDFL